MAAGSADRARSESTLSADPRAKRRSELARRAHAAQSYFFSLEGARARSSTPGGTVWDTGRTYMHNMSMYTYTMYM